MPDCLEMKKGGSQTRVLIKRKKIGCLLLVASILTAAGTADSAPGSNRTSLQKNFEWFGMNLGCGRAFFKSEQSIYGFNVDHIFLKTDLMLLNLHWPRFYLTVLEVHPLFLLGFMGAGTRLGVRLPLTADYRHELRIGAFLGMDMVMFHVNAYHPTMSIKPHLQYVYNTSIGSIGVGVDVLLNLHFREDMIGGDGHTLDVPPLMTGVMAYLRWTAWRRDM